MKAGIPAQAHTDIKSAQKTDQIGGMLTLGRWD